jgi:broad specificity phosphatase PhoE
MERIILARHGETDGNVQRIVNGDPSVGVQLTPAGRDQARELGRRLAATAIDLCVVTEFGRTVETADLALAGRAIPRIVEPRLNDPRLGALEGASLDEVRRWFTANGATVAPQGGESRVEAIRRYRDGFSALLERPEATILVVAHALPVTVALLAAEGRDLPMTLAGLPPGHAEAVTIRAPGLRRAVAGLDRWIRERSAA